MTKENVYLLEYLVQCMNVPIMVVLMHSKRLPLILMETPKYIEREKQYLLQLDHLPSLKDTTLGRIREEMFAF